jgi:hypothetical protein
MSNNKNFEHGQSAPPLDKNTIYSSGMSPNGLDQANIKGNSNKNGFSPVTKPVAKAEPTPDMKGCSYQKPAPAPLNDSALSVAPRPVVPSKNIAKNQK